MDSSTRSSMPHFTTLLLLLGVAALLSGHSLASPLKKSSCHNTKEATLKISPNMSGPSYAGAGDVRKRSLSPWDYRKDINHNRIPSVILEARCHNDWCVDSEGKADHNLNSVPIQHEILVLHREVKGCVLSFKLETKMVTVGCTCVYPVVTERL